LPSHLSQHNLEEEEEEEEADFEAREEDDEPEADPNKTALDSADEAMGEGSSMEESPYRAEE
jgi:hypothetical protein